MFTITVPAFSTGEKWDSVKEVFIPTETVQSCNLKMEHSLMSMSKWEQKYCKPFVDSQKSDEEFRYYLECMTLNSNVDKRVYDHLSEENLLAIKEYMKSPLTATTITEYNGNNSKGKIGNSRITSELIYYYMLQCNIPFEAEKWPLQKLLMLIRICAAKDPSQKKIKGADAIRRNAEINARNRAHFHSKG